MKKAFSGVPLFCHHIKLKNENFLYDNNLELFASKFNEEIEKTKLKSYDINRCKTIGDPIYGSKTENIILAKNPVRAY